MTTAVDMYFDPMCPWAWMTSRWLLEVEQVRDVKVTFKVMSLSVLNEGRDLPADYAAHMQEGWIGARAAIGVRESHGYDTLREFYTALGTRYHLHQQPKTIATVKAALAEIGADESIAERAEADEWTELLRTSHNEGMVPVGDDVGTPVIHLHGKALFGPVISPAPKGEEAGDLFDGVEKVAAYAGFYELKRGRDVGPILD